MAERKHASRRSLPAILFAGAFVFLLTHPVAAQDTAFDQRWRPWLGCWQPPSDVSTGADLTRMCVVPALGGGGVTIVGFINGKETSRQQLDATGERRPVTKDGCTGWESARFSADDRRVYLKSDLTCSGALNRVSSAVLAMSPEGDWIGVESVTAGGGTAVRVTRYREAGVPADAPPEIANAIQGQQVALGAAHIAAGAPIGEAAVIDATRHLSPTVVQAWLVERGQPFDLGASQLASLANAGVPGSVTDVMIALSYPRKFVFDRDARVAELRVPNDSSRFGGGYGRGMLPTYYGRSGCGLFSRAYDPYWLGYDITPFGYAIFPNVYYSLGTFGSRCAMYGYSPYGYGRYGYGSFGYGYWGRTPYAIVIAGSEGPDGQAVNGAGYRRRGQSSGTATRTGVSRGSSSGAASTRGSSGSSSSRGSSGGSSGDRTAHRRP